MRTVDCRSLRSDIWRTQVNSKCQICKSQNREAVESEMRAGKSLRQLAVSWGFSKDAARRHIGHAGLTRGGTPPALVDACTNHPEAWLWWDGRSLSWRCWMCNEWDNSVTFWMPATMAREGERDAEP